MSKQPSLITRNNSKQAWLGQFQEYLARKIAENFRHTGAAYVYLVDSPFGLRRLREKQQVIALFIESLGYQASFEPKAGGIQISVRRTK